MSDTPEMDRLKDRLFGDPSRQTKNFNVFWGPKAHLLTAEQRAAEINRALDAPGIEVLDVDNYQAPRSNRPSVDLDKHLKVTPL